ncbi:MAG: arsenate reductase family protein [Bergeyella sp.]|nr:arsenate reductase family protein [Bergeyella sp.]
MKKVFYLKSCSTNKRIMSVLDLSSWELREIKSTPVTIKELEEMHERSGSFRALFSRKSGQIKIRGIDSSSLEEKDYRALILDHYSFLKRPVFLTKSDIFIGSDKDNLARLYEYFDRSQKG